MSWFKHFKNLKRSFDVNVCTFDAVIFLAKDHFRMTYFQSFVITPPPFSKSSNKTLYGYLRHVCETGLVVLYKEEVKSKNCTKKLIDDHECLVQMSYKD